MGEHCRVGQGAVGVARRGWELMGQGVMGLLFPGTLTPGRVGSHLTTDGALRMGQGWGLGEPLRGPGQGALVVIPQVWF